MAKRRVTQVCSIENCGRQVHGNGMCDSHYHRWKRHGDPLKEVFRFFASIKDEGFVLYFWQKVALTANPDKCWLWQHTIDGMGYGCIRVNRQHYHAHRLAWQLANGRPQRKGLEILHSCDVKACVNPNHLREDTHAENMKEACERGQMQRGSDRFNTHLTEDDVKQIRQHLADGKTGVDITKMYNLSPMAVSNIKHRKSWKHVT